MSGGVPIQRRVGRAECLLVHALVFVMGVVIILDATPLSKQSGYFPNFIGWSLVVLPSISAVSAMWQGVLATNEAPLARGWASLLLLAGFVFSSGHIGFLTSSLWFLPALAQLAGDRHGVRQALMTASFMALAWLVFKLLFAQTMPPELILGEL